MIRRARRWWRRWYEPTEVPRTLPQRLVRWWAVWRECGVPPWTFERDVREIRRIAARLTTHAHVGEEDRP